MRIHFSTVATNHYLQYACLLSHSLIHNGRVPPQAVTVWTTTETLETFAGAARALRHLGVTLEHATPRTKFGAIGQHLLDHDLVVHLDADTYLVDQVDLQQVAASWHVFALATYRMPHARTAADLAGDARRNPQLPQLCQLFHIDWPQFCARFADPQQEWCVGGMYVATPRVLGTRMWNMAAAVEELVLPDDELALMLARQHEDVTQNFGRYSSLGADGQLRLAEAQFPHTCTQRVDFDRRGQGFMHYASHPVRARFADVIASKFAELFASQLLV